MRGIVYIHVAPNGKVYIGQTIDEYNRKRAWLYKKSYAGWRVNSARKEYPPKEWGYAVLVDLNYTDVSLLKAELDLWEVYYIDLFKSHSLSYGYNILSRGDYTTIYPSLSDVTKNKVKKVVSEAKSVAVSQYDLDGVLVCHHSSMFSASKSTGINYCGIIAACNGRQISAGGFQWCRVGEESRIHVLKGYDRMRSLRLLGMPICQYTKDGSFVAEYPSVKAAAEAVGAIPGNIIFVARGINKSCRGFKWVYKDPKILARLDNFN